MKTFLKIALVIGLLFVLIVYFFGGSIGGFITDPVAAEKIVDVAKLTAVVIAVSLGALLLFPLWKVAITVLIVGLIFYGIKSIFFSSKNSQLPKKL